jgi:excisionase family DNA binding protein
VTKPIVVTPQTPPEDLPQFLTVEEWRTFMRIGRSSAYDLIRRGLVPAIRWGRTVRIPREAVMRFVNREGRDKYNNAPEVCTTPEASERSAVASGAKLEANKSNGNTLTHT